MIIKGISQTAALTPESFLSFYVEASYTMVLTLWEAVKPFTAKHLLIHGCVHKEAGCFFVCLECLLHHRLLPTLRGNAHANQCTLLVACRSGWKSFKEVLSANAAGDGSDVCTKCGTGILSKATEADESPGAPDASLVAATNASCYIRAGWGVVQTSLNSTDSAAAQLLAISPCPANTWGASEDTFGLASTPGCTPCNNSLVSDPGSTGSEDCQNPAGYGYSDGGAYPCPSGFWAAAGSMSPCQKCPEGRVTAPGNGTSQSDCLVPAGFGVYSQPDKNPWNPQVANLNMSAKACPVGYHSEGDAAGSPSQNPVCQPCSGLSSTTGTGSSTCDGEWSRM